MTKKPWDGRFKEPNDPLFEKLNKSLPFDIRLYKEDIMLNKVYSKELNRLGIISADELKSIIIGLEKLEKDIGQKGLALFGSEIEDIHMGVETLLSKKIGSAALKMHTGKSRNDQVATDVRMYLSREVDEIISILKDFMIEIVSISGKNIDAVMPGFTHFRQAQPVLFSHYMMSFFFSLERDLQRLADSKKRISILPLGGAALAGTGFPLDREKIKIGLGFKTVSQNSMDAVPARDFILEFLSCISIMSVTLSRLAEDFIIFSSEKFAFFELSDRVTTGSSIMPNKKNPDSLELTRAKTGRLLGNFVALLTVLKGLPSSYNKDLQEDKERLFDSVDTIKDILKVNIILLKNLKINKDNMKESIDPLSFATELADLLSLRGIPFREAHNIVGKIVFDCVDCGTIFTSLTESELVKYHGGFKGIKDDWADIDQFFRRRQIKGGTGIKSVNEQIKYAKKFLSALKSK